MTRMRLRRAISSLAAACALTLLGACAGYKLGPTNGLQAGARSVQINPAINDTIEPRLGPAVTQALREAIQRDGTYRLSTHGDSDIVVTTDLIRFYRVEMAYNRFDTLTPQDYEINLVAHVVATERVGGRELVNQDVRGRLIIRVGTDLVSAERQAVPMLAENLARNIASLLVDGKW